MSTGNTEQAARRDQASQAGERVSSPFPNIDLLTAGSLVRRPDADGLNPWQSPPPSVVDLTRPAGAPAGDGAASARVVARTPVHLLWHLRDITAPLPGQYHVSVPIAGGPLPHDAGARVTAFLEEMWVRSPVATSIRVSSVAATFTGEPHPESAERQRMIVMVTYSDGPGDRRVDGTHMARQLRTALLQLG